jgi:hypothetical protein
VLDRFAPLVLSNKEASIYMVVRFLIKLYIEESTSLGFALLYVIFYFSTGPLVF